MSGQVELCQQCHERPAQVHFSKVVNGEKTEQLLCEDCARQAGAFNFIMGPQFTVQHLLGGLIGHGGFVGARPQTSTSRCEHCGYTLQQFAETGRLGCDHCYQAFQSELGPLVMRLHGRVQHRGKYPKRGAGQLAAQRELEQLRLAMAEAIKREAFEEAAAIRDKIRDLEGSENR
jgi:protein arginine kinase activator